MTQAQRKQRFIIVGGGTAGWMTANLLARRWSDKPIEICLVESPAIGTIGVGEGSTPTLARFFRDLNIAERDWMPACKATYKVSIRFEGWSPASNIESYAHPFLSQLDTFSERAFQVNCRTRRLGLDVLTAPEQFLFNGWLANRGLAPTTPANFPFRIEYGYHFDAGLLGEFLREKATSMGVTHYARDVERVGQHEDGRISDITLAANNDSPQERLSGDFFIDCSGFRGLLIQQTLGVSFRSFEKNLFNDAAVALPTVRECAPSVETRATALSNGWMWQIPLSHRTGNGYVYSSRYVSADEAEYELRERLGLLDSDVEARHLKMRVGQVETHWYKNCLALGLSQGFIEPLEATALHLVQTSAEIFMDHYEEQGFSDAEVDSTQKAAYNKIITNRFERVRDYIVAHYKMNTRDDSEYWRDNRENNVLSESVRQLLDVWYRGGDLGAEIRRQDFDSHFGSSSWHCLLAGYGVFPELAPEQPGRGDLFVAHEIGPLFEGCCMNFVTQTEALANLR